MAQNVYYLWRMKSLVILVCFTLLAMTAEARSHKPKKSKKPSVEQFLENEKQKIYKSNLDKIVENYASYYRVNANATNFSAKQTTRPAKTAKPKKFKRYVKKPPEVPIQKFYFKLNVVQEDIRQVKFGAINLGEKIKDDVAQRYCNEQNLKMDRVVIAILSSQEIDQRRDIKFSVSGSCIKYRYRQAAR